MKILFVAILFIGCLQPETLPQNIPNRGFEEWSPGPTDAAQPNFWETQNEQDMIFVEKGEGLTGNHSACLNAAWDPMLKTYCGARLTTQFDFTKDADFVMFSGFYRGNAGNSDTLIVQIHLYTENRLIGHGIAYFFDNDYEWQQFTIPISYFSDEKPDRAMVSFSVSITENGYPLTTYCVDELLLTNKDISTEYTGLKYKQIKT